MKSSDAPISRSIDYLTESSSAKNINNNKLNNNNNNNGMENKQIDSAWWKKG